MDNSITVYKKLLNLQDATFTRIEHENTIVAIVYKVTQPNCRDRILKICTRTNHYLCETYFLNYFAEQLPVPHILDAVEPATGINGAILMDCLPGTLLMLADMTDDLAYEIGILLAKIHSNKTAGYGDITDPNSLSNHPDSHFTFKFNESLDECANHLPTVLLELCSQYYKSHISLLSSVDGPCIIHRDFRPGNVIVDDGKIMGIIDWAGACGGFAEEDFCPFALGEWAINASPNESFLAGYASIRPIPDFQHVMPLLQLSKAIATIGFTVKTGTWDNINSALYLRSRTFLDEFFGELS